MAYKPSFDQEAKKRAIDRAMPADEPNPIMKFLRQGATKVAEAITPPEELAALKKIKARKTEAKGEARAKERTEGLDKRIEAARVRAEARISGDITPESHRRADDIYGTGFVEQEGSKHATAALKKSGESQDQRRQEGDARIEKLKKKGK